MTGLLVGDTEPSEGTKPSPGVVMATPISCGASPAVL